MRHETRFASTPFGDIAYTEQGGGPPALFVHGILMNGHLWRGVIDRVSDLRRCIAIDLMGHGATRTDPDQDVSFRAEAEMLAAFCKSLGLEQVDVVANDSGGAISQIFAVRHPQRIRSLTLTNCDTHDNWPPDSLKPLLAAVARGGLAAIGRRWLGDIEAVQAGFAAAYEHPELVTEATFAKYLRPLFATPEAVRVLERWFESASDNRQTVEIEPLLRELQAPTQLVWGTADSFFPLRWAYWLHDAIPGARSVVEVEGAKLFFPEERPEALATALREHWAET
jgi:pimeloyl-ACP methyl ester carboxylesterase